MDVARLRNQFDIDFTTESTRNLELREIKVSPLRNLSVEYAKYSMYYNDEVYDVTFVKQTKSIID